MGKNHPAPYAMELKKSWRVIVPLRGKLEPGICPERFTSKTDALSWMHSPEGKQAIFIVRGDDMQEKTPGQVGAATAL